MQVTAYQLTGVAELGLILRLLRLGILKSHLALFVYLTFDIIQVLAYGRVTTTPQGVLVFRLSSAVLAVWVSGSLVTRAVEGRPGLKTISVWTFRFVMPLLLAASVTVLTLDLLAATPVLDVMRTDMLERILYVLSLLTTCFGAVLTIWFRLPLAWNVRLALICWFAWSMTMQVQLVTWLVMASRASVANQVAGITLVMVAVMWAVGLRRNGERRPAAKAVSDIEAAEALRHLRQASEQLQSAELRRNDSKRDRPRP